MACMVPLMLQGREGIAKTETSPESRGIATESRGIGKTRPLEFVQLADHACTPQPMTAMTAMTRDVGDSAAIPLRLRRCRRFPRLHRLPLFFRENISETAELTGA